MIQIYGASFRLYCVRGNAAHDSELCVIKMSNKTSCLRAHLREEVRSECTYSPHAKFPTVFINMTEPLNLRSTAQNARSKCLRSANRSAKSQGLWRMFFVNRINEFAYQGTAYKKP